MLKILKNKIVSAVILSLLISIILSLTFSLDFFHNWQLKLSDKLYSEKEPLNNIIIIAIDDKSLQEIGRWPWPREKFIEILDLLKESKVIGLDISFFESYNKNVDKEFGNNIRNLGNVIIPVEYTEFEIINNKLYGKELLKPIKELENIDLGFVNIFKDDDGVTRTAPLYINGKENHKSLGLKIAETYRGKEINYNDEELIINFIGKPGTFNTISFTDILNKKKEFNFKNKIILVGSTSPDLHDEAVVPTSYGKAMSGVEIHANIIQTLLNKDFLSHQSKKSVILSIFILSLVIAFILARFRLLISIIIGILLFLFYLIFSLFIFNKGVILNLVYPFLTLISNYLSILMFFYFIEGREKKRVETIFGKYVSKEVADEILRKTPEDLVDLKGEEREITSLFADIRGFTSLAEKMKPRQVVALLNKYLGTMTNSVFKYHGTLDKYIGDCIMAIFNAPIKQKDHSLNAIKAALDMQDKINKLNKISKIKVNIGIGINTGEAVIGNMGSSKRVEYTAIGDTVNLASRLCGNADAGKIIISQETYSLVKNKITAKNLGKIKVKGKEKRVNIYEVIKIKKKIDL